MDISKIIIVVSVNTEASVKIAMSDITTFNIWIGIVGRRYPVGQPLVVVSATLRLLALIALDNGMYVVFAAINSHEKITIFRDSLMSLTN